MQTPEQPLRRSTLSICQPITVEADQARDADWLRAVIMGEQAPHFIASPGRESEAWRDIHARNLLERLDPETKISLFITPTGVLGYYNPSLVHVEVRDGQPWGRVIDPTVLPQGEEVALPHWQLAGNLALGGYMGLLQQRGPTDFFLNSNERVYMRTVGDVLPQVAPYMPQDVPVDEATCAHVSFYVSHAGTVTNLHWDVYSGVIHQLKGRKRVIFFSPEQVNCFAMYPNRHIFARRAQIAEKLSDATLRTHPEMVGATGYECIIEPDQWLYIPARWLHHVETLDDDTISLITRFKR